MSVIKAAKLSLDLDNEVVDTGMFKYTAFPLKFKHATRFMPNFEGGIPSSGKVLYHENSTVTADMIDACRDQ
eukprot:10092173-Ditylum_brightwellii.AAC.1